MIHISKITLRNFKSFRRVSLPIPRGFTAIVGPNGSGKSNIVDAICFVLGRSSAKSLRAERFSDLIFNGGKKGKPAREAEVSIYFDNSGRELPVATREVKITRSIDINGNSVYRLNGKRTSRAEILDLLRQVNIRPDGHNIILQGDITRIIEMNPVERRKIIDEIAGIADYDEKKNKALRELEKVKENLTRARDVFREVSSQLEKLAREREAALRYEELTAQVRKNKALVLNSKFLEIKERLSELEQELAAGEEGLRRIARHREILGLKKQVKKEQMERLNREIAVKEESEHYQVFRRLEQARSRVGYLKERLSGAEREVERQNSRLEEAKEGLLRLHRERTQAEKRLSELEREVREREAQLEKQREELRGKYAELQSMEASSAGKREHLSELVARLEEVREKLHRLEQEAALLEEREREASSRVSRLEEEHRQARQRHSEVSSELRQTQEELAAREGELSELREALSGLRERISELRSALASAAGELEFKREELAKLRAKQHAAEELRRSSGDAAVEAVLKLRDSGKVSGIYGTIEELASVDEKFALAIEVAAGRGLRSIVVESDAVAEECIRHLKEHKIGRATFLPLNKIKPRRVSQEARELASRSYGFALELVNFEDRFFPAFSHVFGDTVVVQDLSFARRELGKARMVTLEGDLVEASGRITGGYYRRRAKLDFSRSRLSQLEGEVAELQRRRERLEAELEAKLEEKARTERSAMEAEKAVELLNAKLEALEKERRELSQALAGTEAELREAKSKLLELRKRRTKLEPELRKLREEAERLTAERRALEEELRSAEAEALLREVRALEERLLEEERSLEAKRGEARVLRSRLEEIIASKAHALRSTLLEALALRRSAREQAVRIASELRKAEEELSSAREREAEIKRELQQMRQRLQQLSRAIRLITHKMEELQRSEAELRTKLEAAKIERAKLQAKQESLAEALKEFADVEVELLVPIETEELEKEIAKMEAEIRSLEPVNMRAVEDYEAVKEKYDKLEFRLRKLEEEKEAILRLMDEIEQRKLAVFMEVFENIAQNFRRIFRRLSDGGEAELILDEEAPLEGGLQIQAKPPGKNPQYIELLSGGERTLTALSFLFAIQRYQPAPFYILDEIDMFLDDNNVRKISEMIKEASKEAQFIVVSLRDSMMVAADQLFGVTNEDGVSRIIGVELKDVGV
ncbi:MAG: chromosome segregation protein SMC [Euryarchaeota archaeon]|nr:chromosome segregation protein SMC [Euryarchaeota archaeon]